MELVITRVGNLNNLNSDTSAKARFEENRKR